MFNRSDFDKFDGGPLGLRWSYDYDPDRGDIPPTIEEAEQALGVKLANYSHDASGDRTDGLAEEVYFALVQ